MYHISFIHSSIDEHLGCFHVLAIVFKQHCIEYWGTCIPSNHGFLQIYIQEWVLFAGSYGSSIFSFLRNLHHCPMIILLLCNFTSILNAACCFLFLLSTLLTELAMILLFHVFLIYSFLKYYLPLWFIRGYWI